jgi:hypothetical protein
MHDKAAPSTGRQGILLSLPIDMQPAGRKFAQSVIIESSESTSGLTRIDGSGESGKACGNVRLTGTHVNPMIRMDE